MYRLSSKLISTGYSFHRVLFVEHCRQGAARTVFQFIIKIWHSFYTFAKNNRLKKYLLVIFIVVSPFAKAQKVDNIYVNLYTDSLKKGTFNYINIDGLLSNGKYIPLDSTHLIFSASAGKFSGNSLWIDRDILVEKVSIKVVLRKNPSLFKDFVIYIKKKPDPELKTIEELMKESQNKTKPKKEKG